MKTKKSSSRKNQDWSSPKAITPWYGSVPSLSQLYRDIMKRFRSR